MGKGIRAWQTRSRGTRGLVALALLPLVAFLALAPHPPSLNRRLLSQPVRFSSLRMAGPSSRPPTGPTHAAALRPEPTDITKWAVSGSAALVIATRRDLASVLCVSGAVLNALLAKLLKRLLKEVCHRSRRPPATTAPEANPPHTAPEKPALSLGVAHGLEWRALGAALGRSALALSAPPARAEPSSHRIGAEPQPQPQP